MQFTKNTESSMIQFVKHYAPSVAYCADDIVQDTFVKLYKGIKNWKHLQENELKAYFLMSVRNQTITTLNKIKLKENTYNNNLLILENEDTFFYRDEIELIYQNDSNNNFIKEMSNILSDSLVEILVLKYACNLRNKDIANVLNITQEAVSVRDRRLRQKVAEYLEAKKRRK